MFHGNDLMKQQNVGLLTNGKFGKACLIEFWQSAYDLETKKKKCLTFIYGFKCPKYIIRAIVFHTGHGNLTL